MKKLYILLLSLSALPSYAQNLATDPSFSTLSGNVYHDAINAEVVANASKEVQKASELFPLIKVELNVTKIQTLNYSDPTCNPLISFLKIKDCNPEFRLELVACNYKKCFSKEGLMYGFEEAANTPVYRMRRASDTLKPENKTTLIDDRMKFILLLSRAIDSGEMDSSYRIGFQLVEYNSMMQSQIIGIKTWSITDLAAIQGKSIAFSILNKQKNVKVNAVLSVSSTLE